LLYGYPRQRQQAAFWAMEVWLIGLVGKAAAGFLQNPEISMQLDLLETSHVIGMLFHLVCQRQEPAAGPWHISSKTVYGKQ
jgi:hypothetical protein